VTFPVKRQDCRWVNLQVHIGTDGKLVSADVKYKILGENKFRVLTRPGSQACADSACVGANNGRACEPGGKKGA
jgi:hypothetical protein